MKIENTEVYGFRPAIARAMRNPKNSWESSDSKFWSADPFGDSEMAWPGIVCPETPYIGPKDLKLMKKLTKGGSEHRKFLRQIWVWVDWTLPRYVWTEADTYKVATVRNSCSTMHKLGSRDLEQCDFAFLIPDVLLDNINYLGLELREAKADKEPAVLTTGILRELKNLLPEGFLQMATMTLNYETLLSMYFQRRNHRLPEWNERYPDSICFWIKRLPYMKEFIEAAKK